MRYTILRPAEPLDIRHLELADSEHLRIKLPSISDHDTEEQAVGAVRDMFPDAVAMPVPVRIGSGTMMLMGILPSIRSPYDRDGYIPFVLFVQASQTCDRDRQAIKRSLQFTRSAWKVPVLAPRGDSQPIDIEIRFSDQEQPMKVTGQMYRRAAKRGGRTVLYVQGLGESSMSIEFFDPIPSELL